MTTTSAVPVLCIYRVKAAQEATFAGLLDRHWPTLQRVGLATDEPAQVMKSRDRSGRTVFIETFSWRGPDGSRTAHQMPEVMAIREPMGALCESMEFLDFERVTPNFAAA